MRDTRQSHPPSLNVSVRAGDTVVELFLSDGIKQEALQDLFVGLWLKDRFRVIFDCSHVGDLSLPEVLTLIRFSNEFACRGGFVRLKKTNARVRSTLQGLSCTHLLKN